MTARPDSDQAALALVAHLPPEAPVGLLLLDDDERVLVASPSLARLCGRPGGELAGLPLRDLLPPRARPPVGRLLDAARAGAAPGDLEFDAGDAGHWLAIVRRIDAGDASFGLTLSDVTERGRADAELRESEHMLEAAQRIARIGWWVAESEPERIEYSPGLAEILGAGPGFDWREGLEPEERPRAAAEAAAAIEECRPMRVQLRARRPDGLPLRLDIQAVPIVNRAGVATGLQGITQDVTAIERSGRLQRAIAELGRIGLGADDLGELLAHTRRLVAEGLDVEAAHVEPAGSAATAGPGTGAELRVAIRGPRGLHGTLVAATAAPRTFTAEEVAFLEGAAHVLGEAIARRSAADEIAELAAARGRLVAQALDGEARARRGISDRLHDGPLQDLLAAGHDLYGIGDGPEATEAQERLRAIARELREVTAALHPTVLRYGGLAAALQAVAGQYGARVTITVGDGACGLHDELLLSLARQLLGDAARQEGSAPVAAHVCRAGGAVVLELTHGARFEPGRVALGAATERIAAVGGRLDAGPGPQGGTRISVHLPVP